MPRNRNSRRQTAYLGVQAATPPNLTRQDRPPTVNDSIGYRIGALWLVSSPEEIWMLVNLNAGIATWVQLFPGAGGGATSFPADVGVANEVGGVLNVFGNGTSISTSGSGNTLTINTTGAVATLYTADTGTAIPFMGNLNIFGGEMIDTVAAGSTVSVNLNRGGDGQIPIAATGLPTVYANITSTGGSVTITNGPNTINLETAGGGGTLNTLTGDAGGAVSPLAGNINTPGAHGINTLGNPGAHSMTFAINNAITLGDLSVITTNNNALTLTSGDFTISGTGVNAAGNMHFPFTEASGSKGLIFIEKSGFGPFTFLNTLSANIFMGFSAGNLTLTPGVGIQNTSLGADTLQGITTGASNDAFGNAALQQVSSGSNNDAFGWTAGTSVTTGSNNAAFGHGALGGVTTGSNNSVFGFTAGSSLTTSDSNNVCINYAGIAGSNAQWFFSLGNGTLFSHNYGSGNTFLGANAGSILNVGAATGGNVAVGANALASISQNAGGSAVGNIAIGTQAMQNYTFTTSAGIGGGNIGIGQGSLFSLTNGGLNTATGTFALQLVTTGDYNTMFGPGLTGLTTGSFNTAVGHSVGVNAGGGTSLKTGSYNIMIGEGAANTYNGAESSNLIIGNSGVVTENNAIRIGTSGAGNGQQNKCFIAGIRGITTTNANAIPVLIDSAGQLGTVSSSERYKDNIEDIGERSEIIYDLRPVSFNFKEDESKTEVLGLIAEEVEKVSPKLVIYTDRQPETVKYHEIPMLMLNEMKRLKERLDTLEASCTCNKD